MTLLSARISCACQKRRRVRLWHADAHYTRILGPISSTCTVNFGKYHFFILQLIVKMILKSRWAYTVHGPNSFFWEGKGQCNDAKKSYMYYSGHALSCKALSSASLQACHLAKETNISNKRNRVKNPNWQQADQLAIYKAWSRIWSRDYRETNPTSGRVEALNPGPLDDNTSALNHSATLPP